ncbi:hypothetical protein [Desertibaculum subflavum]|uniref:hypothetical protein n=1 Tax=Desertibaculum subflavum TaxID=2268458 RepID=UPI0013C4A534
MSWWRSSRAAAVAITVLLHAACGEVPRPFEDENKAVSPSPLLVPKADAGMVVVPVRGMAPRASLELAELVAERLRALDLPASTRAANPQSRILEGEATVTTDSAETATLEIVWRIVEPNGLPRTTSRQTARLSTAEWQRADRATLDRLANEIAGRIDRELHAGTAAAAVDLPRVRMPLVEGAPGDGNQSLARAMRLLLGRQQIALVAAEESNAITLLGQVSVLPAGGADRVDIQWIIRASDGRTLGTVRQSNTVPSGTLSGPWGPIAYAAAEGGVDGVMQVLETQRQRRR